MDNSLITYNPGSLFWAPKGAIMTHACNAQGEWGAGIAEEFKFFFPESFKSYNSLCTLVMNKRDLIGETYIFPEDGYKICCFFLSLRYGRLKDSPEMMLEATKSCLDALGLQIKNLPVNSFSLHSARFSSNNFKVPWKDTEKLIKDFCISNNQQWTIWGNY